MRGEPWNHVCAQLRIIRELLEAYIKVTEEARKAGHRAEMRISRQQAIRSATNGQGDLGPSQEEQAAVSPPGGGLPSFPTDADAYRWLQEGR